MGHDVDLPPPQHPQELAIEEHTRAVVRRIIGGRSSPPAGVAWGEVLDDVMGSDEYCAFDYEVYASGYWQEPTPPPALVASAIGAEVQSATADLRAERRRASARRTWGRLLPFTTRHARHGADGSGSAADRLAALDADLAGWEAWIPPYRLIAAADERRWEDLHAPFEVDETDGDFDEDVVHAPAGDFVDDERLGLAEALAAEAELEARACEAEELGEFGDALEFLVLLLQSKSARSADLAEVTPVIRRVLACRAARAVGGPPHSIDTADTTD